MTDFPASTQRTDDVDFSSKEVLKKKMNSPYLYNEEGQAVAWADEEEQFYYGADGLLWDEYLEATMLPADQWSVTNQENIDELKESLDVYDILDDAGIEFTDHGKKLRFCCPFHDDRNPSCDYWFEIKGFKCWSCGAKGDIIDFYWRLKNDGNIKQ